MKRMRKIILFSFLLFIGCSNSEQQNNLNKEEVKPQIKCDNTVQFGDIDICLPVIDGMKECYSLPVVKTKADKFNYEGNSILAYYLNNETYKQVDKINEIVYDDYAQVYVTNKFKGLKAGQSELEKIATMIEGSYIKENWSDLKRKVEKNHDYLSIGRPILIENYKPKSNVNSSVMLTKYLVEDDERIYIMIMNTVIIKERLVFLAYYKDYDGEESIKTAKSKNDYIVLQLADENK